MMTTNSSPENEIIDYIISLGITNIKRHVTHLGFDLSIFLPDYNLAIEYNDTHGHSSGSRITDTATSKQHEYKTVECEKAGVKLFHVFEPEWQNKSYIWKSMIKNACGKSERVYARKCKIVELSNLKSSEFCKNNHMQGSVNSQYCYGLTFNQELVAVMTLGTSRYSKERPLEILRYCNKLNTSVVGGFSKILKHVRVHRPGDIISYANRRWSTGNLYEKSGFTLKSISGPCYYYIDPMTSNMVHRSTFVKQNVLKMFPDASPSDTEVDIMYSKHYRRIWDSGNKIYCIKKDL